MRYKSHLTVHLGRLAHNLTELRKLAPANKILFMVKADAYGHGMSPVVEYSVDELDITEFGCASIGEAIQLRNDLKKKKFELYVFSDLCLEIKECAEAYLDRRILPVLSTIRDLSFILDDKRFKYLPLCLKFNTGMNRLGFNLEEIDQVIGLLKKHGRKTIYHLCTHLACSFSPYGKGSLVESQEKIFQQIKSELQSAGVSVERTSLSNSGAIEQGIGITESHIRPGLMLYGPSGITPPAKQKVSLKLKNISTLQTNIMHLFSIEKGTPIGYGAVPCPRSGTMALIALGYGDGLTRNYEGVKIKYKGLEAQFVGRINMDMAYLLFPPNAKGKLNEGEILTLWGEDPSQITQMAEEAGTIPYELFVTISSRLPRHYQV